jgi:hypothetical protein
MKEFDTFFAGFAGFAAEFAEFAAGKEFVQPTGITS